MAQRRVELFQNVAVHLRRLAGDFQVHFLAERSTEIAHHARPRLGAVCKRPHAAGQRALIQPVREIDGMTIVHLELGQPLQQELLAVHEAPLGLGQGGLRLFAERLPR